jgi:nicotinate-nucleotide adenylyltransferase
VNWDVIEHRFSGIRDRVEIVDVPQLDISSRDLRRRVRTGRPIRYYVPESVRRYIEDRGLYRETREAGCEP